MKKIFTFALVCAAALGSMNTAKAENWYTGGSIGFWHEAEKGKFDTNQFTIKPELGYNINDTWAVGATIGYTYKHWCGAKNTHARVTEDLNIFEISPYARWSYFRTGNNLVQLFVDGGVGFGIGATDYAHGDSKTAVTWNVGFRPGVAFNITKQFSIVTHLGFLGYKGANNAAYDAGEKRQGGVMFDTRDLNIGFYFNF